MFKDCIQGVDIRNMKNLKDYTPKDFKKHLDAEVIGQEDAKKAASVLAYNFFHGVKENAVFIGPSGSGKTQTFKTLKELCPDIYIYDASSITSDGWSGAKKYYSVFAEMFDLGWTKERIEHSIIVFDEFDKICVPMTNSMGENISTAIQAEFLAMIEGTTVQVPSKAGDSKTINTKDITFVFLGAWECIYKKRRHVKEKRFIGINGAGKSEGFHDDRSSETENTPITMQDLIDGGMRPELAGRISDICVLDELTEDNMYAILTDSNVSPIAKLTKMYKREFVVSEDYLKDIAKSARELPTGARGLYSQIQKDVNDAIFESEDSDSALVLGKNK